MKKFIDRLAKWVMPATDKLKHYYLWSLGFFAMIYGLDFIEASTGLYISDWFAFGATVLSALWKEVYHDWYLKKGNPEVKDFIAGIAVALLYMIKIELLIK
jgi:hypothetical protein